MSDPQLKRTGWVRSSLTTVLLTGLMATRSVQGHAQQIVATGDGDARARETADLLSRPVSLHVDRVSLKHALDTIAVVSRVPIAYTLRTVEAHSTIVTVHAERTSLGVVLERALSGTGLHVVGLANRRLAITGGDSVVAPQELGTVTGRVLDSTSGRGIAGAVLKISGTKITTISGDSGRFTMRMIPVGEYVLVARIPGYRPREVPVTVRAGETVTERIRLVAVSTMLSEVVTTATGIQERRAIGNDVTVVNADSVMRVAPVRTVTDLLETRVPGLIVQRTSGSPGAPARLRLRGVTGGLVPNSPTMSNDPIVIVDGVRIYAQTSTPRDQFLAPGKGDGGRLSDDGNGVAGTFTNANFPPPSSIDQIDPNLIDKIEVFKGPSATSQWGADAANGVIVITTKRGRAGRTMVSASLAAGVQQQPGSYASPGYYIWGSQSTSSGSSITVCNPFVYLNSCGHVDSIARFQALNSPRLSPWTTGTSQDGSVTVSGGSGTFTYSVTGAASAVLGDTKMPEFFQDEYALINGKPPRWMRRPNDYSSWSGGGTFATALSPTLHAAFSTRLSNSLQHATAASATSLAALAYQYIDTITGQSASEAAYTERKTTREISTDNHVQGDWDPFDALHVNGVAGVTTLQRSNVDNVPFGVRFFLDIGDTLGYYSIGRWSSDTRTMNAGAVYSGIPWLKVASGVNITRTKSETTDGIQDTLDAGVDVPTTLKKVTQSEISQTTAGWFVEPTLNLHSRFFVSPGLRFDGGNALSGANHARGGGLLARFPKLNFSWIAVDREGEAPFAGILTTLRPRFAFGVAGVQPDPGANTRTYATGAYGGIDLATIGNTKLHPERTREFEGGFDANLWGQRVQLTMTTYDKVRADAILPVDLPPSAGKYAYYYNIGRLRSRGTEITLDAQFVQSRSLTWGAHASFAANRDEIVALNGNIPLQLFRLSGQPLVVGYPPFGRWDRPIVGYSDADGDGRLAFSDISIGDSLAYLGSNTPGYTFPSINTNLLVWNVLGVNATFEYEHGLTQLNSGSIRQVANLYTNPQATLGEQAAALSAEACFRSDLRTRWCSTYGLTQTVNVLRFSELSVNYYVPAAVSKRIRVPHLGIALQGRNLGLWTNYRGKDPDVSSTTLGESSSDVGQIPEPREWRLQVTLGN